MNRRQLAGFTALLFVAGCAGVTLSQLAQYAQAAANAAQDVLTNLNGVANVPPAVAGYITTINTAAGAIVAGAPAAGASWAQQLYDAIKAVLPIAAPLLDLIPVPGISLGLAALEALLPMIATAAGLQAAPLVRTAVLAKVPVISVAQAMKQYGSK